MGCTPWIPFRLALALTNTQCAPLELPSSAHATLINSWPRTLPACAACVLPAHSQLVTTPDAWHRVGAYTRALRDTPLVPPGVCRQHHPLEWEGESSGVAARPRGACGNSCRTLPAQAGSALGDAPKWGNERAVARGVVLAASGVRAARPRFGAGRGEKNDHKGVRDSGRGGNLIESGIRRGFGVWCADCGAPHENCVAC